MSGKDTTIVLKNGRLVLTLQYMKRILHLFAVIALASACCGAPRLEHPDWAPDVKAALNDFLDEYGRPDKPAYVVFDFDNTTSIFDIEENLVMYQLETMSFEMDPECFREAMYVDLEQCREPSEDICGSYAQLYADYGPFSCKGLDPGKAALIHRDPRWENFAAGVMEMYPLLQDVAPSDVRWTWGNSLFRGMTDAQLYELSARSHAAAASYATYEVVWKGSVTHTHVRGVSVTDNLKELWKALHDNGIDVWVCSASGIIPVIAAVDSFGLRPWCTGVVAMTMGHDADGRATSSYDYGGCAFRPCADGGWVEDSLATATQTVGPGKVTAIRNAIAPHYDGAGPLACFMDSTGDFNFCTEFASTRLVVCFNRAHKFEGAGSLVAEVAIYERDVLGYDLGRANAAGDILYVLQGRDENGMRSLRPSNATVKLGADGEALFASEQSLERLDLYKQQNMSVADIFRTFSGGFLDSYAGYRGIKE